VVKDSLCIISRIISSLDGGNQGAIWEATLGVDHGRR
jgi:hypothetical protein